MKKIAALVMAMLMVTCLFAGCAKKEAANDDLSYVKDKGTLVIGITEYAPMNYYDDSGKLIGFDTEFAETVCEKLGVAPEFTVIDWNTKEVELKARNIDCIWNGFTMNGREDDYTFSDPYVDNSIVVVVAKDSDINKLSDLAGKVVDVQADSSGLAALQGDDATDENKELTASFAELQQVADYNTAFMNLESGAVDAVVLDIGVAKYQMSSRGDAFRMLDEQVSSEQYAIGFKKGNTELKDQVQKTLDEMVKDGTFTTIVNNYTDYNLPEMVCLGE